MVSLLTALQKRQKLENYSVLVPVHTLEKPKKERKCKFNVITVTEDKTFVDIDQFKSLEEFSKELEVYAQKNKTGKRKRRLGATLIEYDKPCSSYVSETCIRLSLEKCLSNKDFWSRSGLNSLVANHFISHGVHEEMLQCIIKFDSFDILKTCVKYKKNVTDDDILKMIKHVVSSVTEEDIEKLYTTSNEKCPVNSQVVSNLSYIIAVPFNSLTMNSSLKLLSSNEALVLLQCLHYLFYVVSPALIGDNEVTLLSDITETMVIKWIDALLAAHLVTFTTSPRLQALISQLKQTILKQKHFYADVRTLAPYLNQFQNKLKLPEKYVGCYVLETIKL